MAATDREIAQAVRHPLWRAVVGLLLLAALATAALGGFRKAAPAQGSQLPLLAPGTLIDAGLFQVSAGTGWTTDLAPGRSIPSTDESYLVVPLQVINQAEADFGSGLKLQQDLFWLQPGADGRPVPVEAEYLFRADGGGYGADMPPRLQVPLLAVWKRPAGAPVPPTVDLGLLGRKFVEQTFLTGESAWTGTGPFAKWRVRVQARPSAREPGR